ncbi:MAG: GGDEF domain-containing protein [Candidatus Omnitrophica bacterium]|nr:GGDEF domain-containing protein [Candidatus Omnitrophota bacterium]MDD5737885.1 GGDEF domain-containing protein [Candidatus Omnitrophota bacterium]
MEEAGGGVNCPNKIEDILAILSGEISGSKDKRLLPSVILLLIDIDNLERVNRWYGRHVGDDLLAAVSRTIRDRITGSDLLARFGGDEFLVLLRGVTLKEAKQRSAQILEALSSLEFTSAKLKISASIGIAHYFSFAFSGEELLGCAMEALALAQKEGGTFKVFMEEEEWNEK